MVSVFSAVKFLSWFPDVLAEATGWKPVGRDRLEAYLPSSARSARAGRTLIAPYVPISLRNRAPPAESDDTENTGPQEKCGVGGRFRDHLEGGVIDCDRAIDAGVCKGDGL